jgi:hypothetical protein
VLQFPDENAEARDVVDEILRHVESRQWEPNQFAILFRTNEQTRAFETELRRVKLPYVLVGECRSSTARKCATSWVSQGAGGSRGRGFAAADLEHAASRHRLEIHRAADECGGQPGAQSLADPATRFVCPAAADRRCSGSPG